MPDMWWWVTGAAVVLLAVAYLSWLAARLGRLHRRAAAATAALEAALLRRAAAAAVLAERRDGVELYAAARIALDAGPEEREAAENDLTRQLRSIPLDPTDPDCEAVIAASRRLALARQVHTDLVRDALALRRRVLVRLFRLARRYPEPAYFDVDEPVLPDPAGISDRPSRPRTM